MSLIAADRDAIPAAAEEGFVAVLGSQKVGMALGAVRFATQPRAAACLFPQAVLPEPGD
jgi:hypothetical protein